MATIQLAAQYAMDAHAGQYRADGVTPYYYHPFKVAALVIEWGGSDEQVAAAYLHDVLEDTAITAEELLAVFGSDVVNVIKELTFPADMENRREVMLACIPHMSKSAALVKLADATANLIDLPCSGWDLEKVKRHTKYCTKIIDATMLALHS